MKTKTTVLILLIALVLLLAGAFFLYHRLAADGPDLLQEITTEGEEDNAGTQETEEPPAEDSQTPSEDQEPVNENAAPDFTVYDGEGNPVQLSDFFGTPIVLNFWASWCGPCKSEMPAFQEAFQEYGDEVTFLMVNSTDGSRETVDTAAAFINHQGYTFPVYYDTSYEAAITYQVYGLPTTYLIDREGNIVAQAVSAIDAATLQRGLDMILPHW